MTTDLVLGRGLKEINVTMKMLLMGNCIAKYRYKDRRTV